MLISACRFVFNDFRAAPAVRASAFQPRTRILLRTMEEPKKTHHTAGALLLGGTLVPMMVMLERHRLPEQLGRRPELLVLGILGCSVVAMANGANDIANSVGTSFGAGALTLRQAIGLGAAAEFSGAMALGSFVAKTISKGVIEPASFAADGCHGDLDWGLGMLSVLAGTGSTTLLATLYGLPISATHGVVGGLVALGTYTHGVASLGRAPLYATVVAWVASPLVGAVVGAFLHLLVRVAVHETSDPAAAAHKLQPLLVALTTAVAAAVLIVAGPAVLRLEPMPLALAASGGVGVLAALGVLVMRRLRPPSRTSPSTFPHVRHEDERVEDEAEKAPLEAAARAPQASLSTADGEEGASLCCPTSSKLSTTSMPIGAPAPGSEAVAVADGRVIHTSEERPFVPLLVLSALTVSFAHGANDLGNSIGPLAAILVVERAGGDITQPASIPLWLLALGSCGFVVGIVLLGARTIVTVGGKITKLTPSRSFAVQLGTAVAVLSSTVLGLAVSTSHCLVGAIVGIGLCDRLRGGDGELNGSIILKIVLGWAATIPLAMIITVLAYMALLPSYAHDPVCAADGGNM